MTNRVKKWALEWCRDRYLNHNKRKLKNINPTVIASNCNGGCILHDLDLRFNSPFVNLWIKPRDYIKLLDNLERYMDAELVETHEEGIDYPIGLLLDVSIYFQHYVSFDEAAKKWNERKERMDYNNLFIIFTDRDGCSYEDLLAFDRLNFNNKVVFTCKRYDDIQSSFWIKGFENEKSVGMCFDYMSNKKWMKYYNQFDFVTWFNGESKE